MESKHPQRITSPSSDATERRRGPRWSAIATCGIALAAGVFFVLTLHPGQDWSGDFAQYIHHAKNLAEGRQYVDTGYIATDLGFVGPYAYPPVFPILLAPVYWLRGLDFEALKLVGITSFCLMLLFLPRLFGSRLTWPEQLTVVLLVAFNPFCWESRNNILSDFSFVLFSYLSLWMMQRYVETGHGDREAARVHVSRGVLLGIAMYLAYGCREVGVVLPLTVLTYELVVRRRVSPIAVSSILVFAVLAFAQHRLLAANLTPVDIQNRLAEFSDRYGVPSASSHLDFVSLDPLAIAAHIQGYRWALQSFLPFHGSPAWEQVATILVNSVTVLSLVGFGLALRSRITVLEVFAGGYSAAILLFGGATFARYLLPVFPLILYYAVIAYRWLLGFGHVRVAYALTVGILTLTGALYVHGMRVQSYDDLDFGIEHPDAVAMFDFIRNNTGESDTIASENPRIMSLLAERDSFGSPGRGEASTEKIHALFDAVRADYLVECNRIRWIRPLPVLDPPTPRFTEVFRNPHFAIYRFAGEEEVD